MRHSHSLIPNGFVCYCDAGIIAAFNTSCPKSLEPKARQMHVTILQSRVIYHLINDVKGTP
jgi:translation initiation factor IF-2